MRGYKLGLTKSRKLTLGWALISLPILIDLILGFLYGKNFNESIEIFSLVICMTLDLFGGYIIFDATLVSIKSNKGIIRNLSLIFQNNIFKIGLFILTLVLGFYLFIEVNVVIVITTGVLYSFMMFTALYGFHLYLKKLTTEYNGDNTLVFFSKLFAIIQLFSFVLFISLLDKSPILSFIIILLYAIGFICKFFILYGLITVFVKQSEFHKLKDKDVKNIAIRSRIFHDILLVCDTIESSIEATLNDSSSKIDRRINLSMKYINSMNLSIKSIISSEKAFKFLKVKHISWEITNLNTIVQLIVRILSKEDLNNIKVSFTPGSKCNIKCIPSDIIRILQNLVKNSKESINLSNQIEEAKIDISTYRLEIKGVDYVFLTFKDNGIGIPFPNRDKIWDLGFSTRSKRNASGIGLYNVSKIVDKNDAHIELIDGIDNKGVGFKIKFKHYLQNNNE